MSGSGLFSPNNLLPSGMQGNDRLLAKTLKMIPKSPVRYTYPVSTFDKFQGFAVGAFECLNEHK